MFKTSDPKHPYPHQKGLWDKTTNTYLRGGPPWYDRIVIPSVLVREEDYIEWIELQLPSMAESAHSMGDPGYNIFLCKKEWENGTEIGIASINGKGLRAHKHFSKKIERYLNMKAFW